MKTFIGNLLNRCGGARIALWLSGASVALLLVATGCTTKTESVAVDPTGTYALVSVDGKALPCSVQHNGSVTIKSGEFNINGDGTCSSKIILTTNGKEVTQEVKANYTRDGSTLLMKWERAGTTKGSVQGNTFTMNNEGMVFAYRK